MKRFIASLSILRLLFIPILKFFNFSFKWKHDITRRDFFLETYYHKGYWYYGKARELKELKFLNENVKEGDIILEVGAHIGYLSQIFESLIGEKGQLAVIEPAPENLVYLKQNTLTRTKLINKAVSDYKGESEFYIENFGGFTNSLSYEFTKSSNEQHQKSQNVNSKITAIKIKVDTIDNICQELSIKPNFIKIDIEGLEHKALIGSQETLKIVEFIMVEITRNKEEILKLLKSYKFELINYDKTTGNYYFKKI